jgi:23S rRNA (adenine-N6)-dimethyltransferase
VPGRPSRQQWPARPRPARSGRARPGLPANPAGAHFLVDRGLITRLVRASGVGAGDLVFDFGAGYGALTAPLARAGARVIAVERDPRLAERLRRRFSDDPLVGVVEADLRLVPLPRRPFHVVASPPFSLTTLLCRRLLGDHRVRLAGADLILEWGAALMLAAPEPRSEAMRWAARYEIRLLRRVPATAFSPAPRSDAAHLVIRPRRGGC